jgi:hypothetical protein
MTSRRHSRVACIVALVALGAASISRGAPDAGGRVEGLVLDVQGRPAVGYLVHLIDEHGEARRTTTSSAGLYSFHDVPAGAYGLGIETPQGAIAPSSEPPLRLAAGALVRRDLRLVTADALAVSRAATANYGIGTWWGSLGPGAKAGVLVATLAVAWGIYEAVDDDDDDEPCASPPCS